MKDINQNPNDELDYIILPKDTKIYHGSRNLANFIVEFPVRTRYYDHERKDYDRQIISKSNYPIRNQNLSIIATAKQNIDEVAAATNYS